MPVNVGQDLHLEITWNIDGAPVDLTGASAVWQFGKRVDTAPLLSFSSDDDDPVISFGGANGKIILILNGEITEQFSVDVRYHILVITLANDIERRILEGPIERFGEFINEQH